MSGWNGDLLVLGVGNVLLGDDGVGVHVVRSLRELADSGVLELPPDTSVVDGGTLGRDLLPWLADARAVVIVDAMDADLPPGSVELLCDPVDRPRDGHVATHESGVADLLDSARVAGVLPRAVSLIGVQPDAISVGLQLSEPVRSAVPIAVEATVAELRRLEATRRSTSGRPIDGLEASEAMA